MKVSGVAVFPSHRLYSDYAHYQLIRIPFPGLANNQSVIEGEIVSDATKSEQRRQTGEVAVGIMLQLNEICALTQIGQMSQEMVVKVCGSCGWVGGRVHLCVRVGAFSGHRVVCARARHCCKKSQYSSWCTLDIGVAVGKSKWRERQQISPTPYTPRAGPTPMPLAVPRCLTPSSAGSLCRYWSP